jgi:hypothetical protein
MLERKLLCLLMLKQSRRLRLHNSKAHLLQGETQARCHLQTLFSRSLRCQYLLLMSTNKNDYLSEGS